MTSVLAGHPGPRVTTPPEPGFDDPPVLGKLASRLGTVMLIMAMLLPATGGCTGDRIVFGHIPPSTFQFVTVVELDGPGAGGWQVAQVVVLLGRLSTMFPRAAFCDVEVGMPIVNTQQGYIPVEMAQMESAMAAMFNHPDHGTVAGSRVSGFHAWKGKKIPRKKFPPKRGR